jgi:uncharacterized protein
MTKQHQPEERQDVAKVTDTLNAIARSVRVPEGAPVHLWNPPYCGDIGLEIKADGAWFYQGTPITRPALIALFASVLRKDEDGKTYLVTPAEKIDVRVADAPFLGVEIAIEGSGETQAVSVRTNLETWVTIGTANPIRFGVQAESGGLKPYVLVRGRLEALLTRAMYFELVDLAMQTDPPGFWSMGTWWPLMPAKM